MLGPHCGTAACASGVRVRLVAIASNSACHAFLLPLRINEVCRASVIPASPR
jgi:hypothetical protein